MGFIAVLGQLSSESEAAFFVAILVFVQTEKQTSDIGLPFKIFFPVVISASLHL